MHTIFPVAVKVRTSSVCRYDHEGFLVSRLALGAAEDQRLNSSILLVHQHPLEHNNNENPRSFEFGIWNLNFNFQVSINFQF